MVEVILPKVDMDMTDGTIAAWHHREGDAVRQGETLFDITTNKADIGVEAPASGTLWGIRNREGDTVPIGMVVAYILGDGEQPPADGSPTADASSAPPAIPAEPTRPAPVGPLVATEGNRARATPLARKIGREHGVDLGQVAGSGPKGRVHAGDVRSFLDARATPTQPVTPPPVAGDGAARAPSTFTRVPLVGVRRVVAERMLQSARSTPTFTLTIAVDMTEAIALRQRVGPAIERQVGAKPSFTALLIRALAPLMAQHPYLNASFADDAILLYDHVHIGIALDRDDDLVVPVLRDAQGLSLAQITKGLTELVDRARARSSPPAELRGSTFTISNLGMYGIDSFTAIINPPESAILAVGRIAEIGVARDGALVARPMMNLTLTADHRVVNGAAAARFLQELRARLEDPYLLL